MTYSAAHANWQERTIQYIGIEKSKKLGVSNILVTGLGGVGAIAAEMLCRAGIGNLTIVDGDVIQPGKDGWHVKGGNPAEAELASSVIDKWPWSAPFDVGVAKRIPKEEAIARGKDIGEDIARLLQRLAPLYLRAGALNGASVGQARRKAGSEPS